MSSCVNAVLIHIACHKHLSPRQLKNTHIALHNTLLLEVIESSCVLAFVSGINLISVFALHNTLLLEVIESSCVLAFVSGINLISVLIVS